MAFATPEDDTFIEINGYYGLRATCGECGKPSTDTEIMMYGSCGPCLDKSYQAYCDAQYKKDSWRRFLNKITFGLFFKPYVAEEFDLGE